MVIDEIDANVAGETVRLQARVRWEDRDRADTMWNFKERRMNGCGRIQMVSF